MTALESLALLVVALTSAALLGVGAVHLAAWLVVRLLGAGDD